MLVLLLKSLFQITCLLAYQFRPLFALHGLMHMKNSTEPYLADTRTSRCEEFYTILCMLWSSTQAYAFDLQPVVVHSSCAP